MRYCTQCGKTLEEGAAFCTECGAKVEGASSAPSVPPKRSKTPYIALGVLCVLVLVLVGLLILQGFHNKASRVNNSFTEKETAQASRNCGDAFAGDWYGWWIICDAQGTYQELDGSCWDACARIFNDGDGKGSLLLWDEDNTEDTLLGKAYVCFTEDSLYTLDGGFFAPDNQLETYSWVIPLENGEGCGDFPGMISIAGYYSDADQPENSFTYYVFLRPWGMDWEDVRTGDTSECYFEDMMPPGYDSWYLPLLQEGVTEAPAQFYP